MRDDCELTRHLLDRQDRVLRAAEKVGLDCLGLQLETGVSKHTWASYKRTEAREPSVMPLSNFLKLAKALEKNRRFDLVDYLVGNEFNMQPSKGSTKDWLSFAERTAGFSAKVLRYQATDNMIDHREDADLTEEARQLASDAQAMIA